MRIHKANWLHLFKAARYLSASDRAEMGRIASGRDPIDVLTASSNDPTVKAISDDLGNVLAVGGHSSGVIWFVHTKYAERLGLTDRLKMLRLLTGHLANIKIDAIREHPNDTYHFTNIVSEQNTAHIRLLNHLGATWVGECDVDGFRQFLF
ncbi:phage protein Gp13 family protein [Pseudomonas guariconensis]|uniref:phage protein Gp13 family protein n=1 Tax=Pseudomonas guariconensis TaxID=1288410 RepID=UPI002B054151|nr:phage protein Gp13 family protein [Pseudomonas guariconensis]